MHRRRFLAAAVGAGAALASGMMLGRHLFSGELFSGVGARRRKIPGRILGAAASIGHRLRRGTPVLSALSGVPTRTETVSCVVVGGGMAGLSAAWRLRKKGFSKFVLLELDSEVGGNSRSGETEVSAYPWGAHYVPIPNADSFLVRELFEELGVITGHSLEASTRGLPLYNETYLCADPQERLLLHGRWQEGLIPQFGVPESEQRQYRNFLKQMDEFRTARGADGRPAFAIPLEGSSQDSRFRRLDALTMEEYLKEKGWDSPHLRWYVNYCCRDDYGGTLDQVSAWAGIHYFAGRSGRAANAAPQSVLTWPEGNGWLVKRLRERVQEQVRTGSLVYRISRQKSEQKSEGTSGFFVDYLEIGNPEGAQRTVRLIADHVIFAAPRFIARHVIEGFPSERARVSEAFHYAPWMVANVSVDSVPAGHGAPLSWDNVSYQSPSLGYVLSTHQEIVRYSREKSVLTYYLPLSDEAPEAARKSASKKSLEDWQDLVVGDLSRMHPGIESRITRLDVWIWGHGMIRPGRGFIWGKDRKAAAEPWGRLVFAHSDLSGISIFEEAQYWGVRAADQVLAHLPTVPDPEKLKEQGS
ncbi:MAG: NAD(P)-binding protein [Methylotenera sp.]|nr:NAD(P)-binding protein [Oligoflexia bacterium]